MFYLISCDKDESLCTVEDYEIVCDLDQPPTLDENVEFFYGKEKYTGTVVGISESDNTLKEKAKQIKRKRKAPTSPDPSSSLPLKRSRKPKKSFSFTDKINDPVIDKMRDKLDKKNQKKYSKNLQVQVKSKIRDGAKDSRAETSKQKSPVKKLVAESPETSPSKEELKMMLERQSKLLASYRSPSGHRSAIGSKIFRKRNESDSEDGYKESSLLGSGSDDDSDDKDIFAVSKEATIIKSGQKNGHQSDSEKESINTKDDTTLNPQLWGKNCGESVVMLKNNIYCKKAIFDGAEDLSRKSATSFLRRLMDGVFKPDVLLALNCTYSGRPPSAQGKDKQLEKVVPLDRLAKKTLIEYCNEYATQKGWPKSNQGNLSSAMSQWLGELKRGHRKNLERNT